LKIKNVEIDNFVQKSVHYRKEDLAGRFFNIMYFFLFLATAGGSNGNPSFTYPKISMKTNVNIRDVVISTISEKCYFEIIS